MSIDHNLVDVGTPTSDFGRWETVTIRFHGFADMPTTKGKIGVSTKFTAHGHQWWLMVYPGGHVRSDNGWAAYSLRLASEKSIELDVYGLFVKNSKGVDVVSCCGSEMEHVLFGPWSQGSQGDLNFASRRSLSKALVAGTLVIEIRMKRADSSPNPPPFIVRNPSLDMVRNLFLDEKSADVVFKVTKVRKILQTKGSKRWCPAPVEFHAHSFVLKQCAPMLAALCPEGGTEFSVTITDILSNVFHHLLSYLYGREVGEDGYKSYARQIIEAADRYAIVNLKLEAEAWYVRSTKIDLDNVMELLLYSDAKNLALLKEAVMDFIVNNGEDILKKVSLNDVPGGLFADLLAAVTRGKKTSIDGTRNDDVSTMRISDLRKRLHDKGLGIDGSREMLIAALEQST